LSANISYKLKNSLQGALAGGGDPATSPLYVFGPFLSLIVGAGVANVTFGVSIWLAVLTVFVVSSMYRYVMKWITDGSGGSGLSEEEFGSWAVKINAAITVIEYTLTFLVSMAALVTFVADRFPILNETFAGISFRTAVAIALSALVAFTVNRGSKMSSRLFGPATAAILAFLWLMIIAVIWQRGFEIPDFNLRAFDSDHLHFTLGGFARILALMTGIEIFANLVAAYDGSPAERSRKAFGSLIIVMGTTVATMLIVGPAIFAISNLEDKTKSVFTQTMDAVLPHWLSYTGTFIGIAVLLSAAAASAQGIQNLALGLRARHYIPAKWGQRNKFDVAAFPAWLQAAFVIIAFLFLGTHEETYLALYAAGVFILLSMTGWSAGKRFLRKTRANLNAENILGLAVSTFSAICASFATFIIFEERFKDGAWSYLVMVPFLYFVFDFYRRRLGAPPESLEKHLAEFHLISSETYGSASPLSIAKILVPLDRGLACEVALRAAQAIAKKTQAIVVPIYIEPAGSKDIDGETYLDEIATTAPESSRPLEPRLIRGDKHGELLKISVSDEFQLICMSSTKMNSKSNLLKEQLAYKIIYETTPPVLLYRPTDQWQSRRSTFKNILVPLDGSPVAEQMLPLVAAWAVAHSSDVTLLSVPEVDGDETITSKLEQYLADVRSKFFAENFDRVTVRVEGSGPSRTVLGLLNEPGGAFDLVALVSHGRGGVHRQDFVKLGSVSDSVMAESDVPVLFISAR
jgi:nucleotide-binding universal stress UspA family protein